MILSFDVPDIVRLPIGTCWPLIGVVILTLCAIGDEGDNNLDAGGAGRSLFAVGPVTLMMMMRMKTMREAVDLIVHMRY